MGIKWREFWRLEGLELVGEKRLSWVRILKEQKENRKGVGRVECVRVLEVVETWRVGARVLECWTAGVGTSAVEGSC